MTPKEKAEELVDKFIQTNGNAFFAKECALIAVDEIIKYSPNKPIEEYDPIEYFNKVKQEIKNI